MRPEIAPRNTRATNLLHRLTLSVLLISLPASHAWAELMLYPTRIVFAGNQRAAQLELINNGSERATYRISLVNRRMNETGAFSEIDTPLPGEQFADDLLRYSPRQVTLEPGTGQAVRIMVRKPANLPTGEYRSHLLFAQQPEAQGSTSIEDRDPTAKNEIAIKLTTLVGVSIPVIVRHGNTDASVSLTHLELQQPSGGAPTLALQMERSGSQSVYGDLSVSLIPARGAEQVIARANGVAVYSPNLMRRASIALQRPNGQRLTDGALRVSYREQAEDGGELLAEAVLQLP
jgi:P pilus assembly chaperone PapD